MDLEIPSVAGVRHGDGRESTSDERGISAVVSMVGHHFSAEARVS
ncbi:hypothetical protein [Nocardia cyriacigeorgica]|nr:hypothetical protein [Nocardia cyriacigeorgica]